MTIPKNDSEKLTIKKTIRFHIFEYIYNLSNNGIHSLTDGKTCSECKTLNQEYERVKIYTNKGLELIE